MGEWTRREANNHKCDYPKFGVPPDTAPGDIWKCACGREWRVSKVKTHPGDTRSIDPRERATTYTAEFEPYYRPGIVPR